MTISKTGFVGNITSKNINVSKAKLEDGKTDSFYGYHDQACKHGHHRCKLCFHIWQPGDLYYTDKVVALVLTVNTQTNEISTGYAWDLRVGALKKHWYFDQLGKPLSRTFVKANANQHDAEELVGKLRKEKYGDV